MVMVLTFGIAVFNCDTGFGIDVENIKNESF
jgi:hypothetical protein